jgi:hypothetical protein
VEAQGIISHQGEVCHHRPPCPDPSKGYRQGEAQGSSRRHDCGKWQAKYRDCQWRWKEQPACWRGRAAAGATSAYPCFSTTPRRPVIRGAPASARAAGAGAWRGPGEASGPGGRAQSQPLAPGSEPRQGQHAAAAWQLRACEDTAAHPGGHHGAHYWRWCAAAQRMRRHWRSAWWGDQQLQHIPKPDKPLRVDYVVSDMVLVPSGGNSSSAPAAARAGAG